MRSVLCLTFLLAGVSQAKHIQPKLDIVLISNETESRNILPKLEVQLLVNETEEIDPSLLTPKLEVQLLTNETEVVDPSLLTPKMALDRATTDCGCGYAVSNPNPAAGRIVGGSVVTPQNKLPYQVFVQPCFADGCGMCGGTLINKRYVLTAMHCIKDGANIASNVLVKIGDYSLNSAIETIPQQNIPVANIIMRDDYDEQTTNNDIALLRLSSDVVFNANVVPACLPTDPNNLYVGQQAVVSGWGATSSGGSTSDLLKETTVKIVANSDSTCLPKYGNIGKTRMCAYAAGTNSCQGDSGGPLVVKEDGRYTVVGVVSYGIGCANADTAGVYARVNNYLDWINTNVADGWCSGTNPPVQPTTASPTTQAPATSGACDLRCVGTFSGNYLLNGLPATCSLGICTSTDGSNLCSALGFPCGVPTAAPTTAAPTTTTTKPPTTAAPTTKPLTSTTAPICNLRCINSRLNGIYQINGIQSTCTSGRCSATNGSDLCKQLRYPCGV